MGCLSSKVQEVELPKDTRQSGWVEEGAKNKSKIDKSEKNVVPTPRDGSALSKSTLDSGVGFEDEPIPGTVPETIVDRLPSSRDRLDGLLTERSLFGGGLTNQQGPPQERAKSSVILEELMMQGIIQSQPRFVRNGEAYDVMVEGNRKPLKRPPAKLEKLKTKKKKKKELTKEDIDNKIRAAEERRKTKEEELKKRLRTERPFTALALRPILEYRGEGDSMAEEEQGPSARSPPPVLNMDEELGAQKHISFLETALEQEEGRSQFEDVDDLGALEADETFNHQNVSAADSASDIFE